MLLLKNIYFCQFLAFLNIMFLNYCRISQFFRFFLHIFPLIFILIFQNFILLQKIFYFNKAKCKGYLKQIMYYLKNCHFQSKFIMIFYKNLHFFQISVIIFIHLQFNYIYFLLLYLFNNYYYSLFGIFLCFFHNEIPLFRHYVNLSRHFLYYFLY
jgi:hypothetical protein